jgi:hypothetical protein
VDIKVIEIGASYCQALMMPLFLLGKGVHKLFIFLLLHGCLVLPY